MKGVRNVQENLLINNGIQDVGWGGGEEGESNYYTTIL